MESLVDLVGFMIILAAIILNFSQVPQRKKPKPVQLEPNPETAFEPIQERVEIQKRIPTRRAQKHTMYHEEISAEKPIQDAFPVSSFGDMHDHLAQSALTQDVVKQESKEKRKSHPAKEMMIHYEIFSAPKAFRLK